MAHGGGIAILGIPTEEISLDVNEIVFKLLTIAGHLRPGDVRDLVQDDGDAPVRAWTSRPRSPTASRSATTRRRSPTARSGDSGKVIMDWTA